LRNPNPAASASQNEPEKLLRVAGNPLRHARLRTNSGSFATLAAIRSASRRLAADVTGHSTKNIHALMAVMIVPATSVVMMYSRMWCITAN